MTWGGHTFVQIQLWCLPFSSGGSWAMGKWSDEHSQSMSLRLTSYWSTTDIATWKCLKEISIGTCNKQLDIYVRKRDLFKSFDTNFPMNFPVEKFIQLKILKDKGQSNRVRVSASPRRPRRRDCTAFQRLGATRRWKGTWRSWRSDSKDRSPRPRPQVMYFIVAQGQQDPPFSIWAIVHQWWTRRSKHRRRGGRPACRREGPGCDHRRPPRTDSGGSPPACPSCGCSRGRWWSGRPCELCSGSPHSTRIRWMIPLISFVWVTLRGSHQLLIKMLWDSSCPILAAWTVKWERAACLLSPRLLGLFQSLPARGCLEIFFSVLLTTSWCRVCRPVCSTWPRSSSPSWPSPSPPPTRWSPPAPPGSRRWCPARAAC